MTKDFFRAFSAAEYRALKPVEHLTFVNGMAVNSEDDLCASCVAWFDRTFGYGRRFDLIHIPNEGKRTVWEGKRLQRMGLRAGTPDYLVQNNGKPVGWTEFKFGKNTLTKNQKDFKQYAEQAGFKFAEVRTFDEFRAVLKDWGIVPNDRKDELRTSFEKLFKKEMK